MKLKDKVVIVTGAGSGQGRAAAILFAREGAKIAAADINDEGGTKTADIIESSGGTALFQPCDVSDGSQARALVERTVEAFGRVDILYSNAARNRPDSPVPERVADMPEDDWLGTIDTNLTGMYYSLVGPWKVRTLASASAS